MSIVVNLIDDGCPVLVDDRCAEMGGSFYYTPLRPYSPAPLKWCYEHLNYYPDPVLLDVGAHTGCYTLLAKHISNLIVRAFEPVRDTVKVLQENIRLNELEDRVFVYPVGVSNYLGEGILHAIRSPQGSGISMVDGIPAHHKDVISQFVNVVSIDDICKQTSLIPTFIKIDTEGGEKFVIQGAQETIEKYRPFIICEYSSENTGQYGYMPNEIIKLLEDLGYSWVNSEGTDLFCVPLDWQQVQKQRLEAKEIIE